MNKSSSFSQQRAAAAVSALPTESTPLIIGTTVDLSQQNATSVSKNRQRRSAAWITVAAILLLAGFVLARLTTILQPSQAPSSTANLVHLFTDTHEDATASILVQSMLQDLQRQLQGQVLLRPQQQDESVSLSSLFLTTQFANNQDEEDNAFTQAAHVWNQCYMEDAPPLAVIEVANEADVQVAVPILTELDRTFGIPWRIRSGGHSYAGWSSVPNGIILSLSHLNQVAIQQESIPRTYSNRHDDDQNKDHKTVVLVNLGPAVRVQDELQQLLQARGLGSVMGWCGTVGVGGYTLGGGNGAWARQYGLGLDQVVAMRLVLANGTVAVVNDKTNSDLFWALRGAGQNNFGVVTEFTYRYYPSQDEMTFATVILNTTSSHDGINASNVLHRLALIEPTIPGQIGAFLAAASGPVGAGETYNVSLWYVSETPEKVPRGQNELQKVFAQLPVQQDSVQYHQLSWSQFSLQNAHYHDDNMVRIWNGFLLPQFNTPEACRHIIANLNKVVQTSPYTLALFELWGGAMSQVAPTATAFYWRQGVYNVRIVLLVPITLANAAEIYQKTIPKLEPYWNEVARFLNGTYVNYATASLRHSEYARVSYGGNLERLQALKQKYDPNNVFRHPHSVPLPTNHKEDSFTSAERRNERETGT